MGALRDDPPDWPVAKRYELAQERRGLAAGTIQRRRRTLRRFMWHLAPQSILEATREDVETWLDGCRIAARSRYVYLSTLCSFYDFAVAEELVAKNPVAPIPRPKYPGLLPRPLAEDDFAHAYRQAPPLMRCWLALAAFQGFRCLEIAGVRAEDLLLDRDPPLIIVSQPKGGRERILPLHPEVERALRVYGIPGRGPVFVGPGGRPWKPGTVSSYIARHLQGSGVRGSAHRLRHLFGTKLYETTRDIRITQAMLGHADPKTTTIYVSYSEVDAARAVRSLSFG